MSQGRQELGYGKSTIRVKGLKILQQYPREELYRLIVDGRFHSKEQGWIGYEEREPGSLKAVFEGLTLAITHLENSHLTSDYIKQLHKACTTNVNKMCMNTPGVFHNHYIRLSLPPNETTRDGLFEIIKMMRAGHASRISCYEKPEFSLCGADLDAISEKWEVTNDEELTDQLFIKLNSSVELFYFPPAGNRVEDELNLLCERYNNEIKFAHNENSALEIIIQFIYAAEHLHPFNDGNTRTFSIALLFRLLLQNGFSPATQFNPNFVEGFSVKEFASEIRYSMQVTQNLINGSQNVFGFSSENIPLEKKSELFAMTEHFIEVFNSELERLDNENLLTKVEECKSEESIPQGLQLIDELDKVPTKERLAFIMKNNQRLTDAIQCIAVLEKLENEDKVLFYKNHAEKIKNGRQLVRMMELFPENERYHFAIQHVICETMTDLSCVMQSLPLNLRSNYLFHNEKLIKNLRHLGGVLDLLSEDEEVVLKKTLFPIVRYRQYPEEDYKLNKNQMAKYEEMKLKFTAQTYKHYSGLNKSVFFPISLTIAKEPSTHFDDKTSYQSVMRSAVNVLLS